MTQEIHFVTGKGGVGKSAFAAAFARSLASSGKKTLLVELGDYSFYKDYLGLHNVHFLPTNWVENVDVCLWRGEDCLYEYAHYLIKVESLVKLFFNNSVMKTFIQIAPALSELAIMGKITSHHRQHGPPLNYDAIVIDAYASGHFKALINAPQAMYQSFQFGPMAQQSQGIDRVLKNQTICHYHIVTLPEELPVKEAFELSQDIQKILGQSVKIYLNKCISLLINNRGTGQSELNNQIQHTSKTNDTVKNDIVESDDLPFLDYLQDHQKQEQESLAYCRKASSHVRQLPLILSNDPHVVIEQLEKAMP